MCRGQRRTHGAGLYSLPWSRERAECGTAGKLGVTKHCPMPIGLRPSTAFDPGSPTRGVGPFSRGKLHMAPSLPSEPVLPASWPQVLDRVLASLNAAIAADDQREEEVAAD